ncbi:transketolase [Erwiniaceae bacterium BAC15a-03b]|uniref:Transketolase n=1 Tax=Winslowiella arboricola TaxID=2978220 RepID=A0A9J6PUH0_9GAMM|nr:transketolase [Winslowiella arboricola]MCU5775285.1 transketolase [Winslowiella arboricola]MCU5780318.1 transketolase [Winslowiella arboricola]
MENRQLANALRFLSIDAVQNANSGHPGAPLGMADMATVLWHDFLQHNPANPNWLNRDRFVLSNGHSSMLLYSLLHLTGYDVSIDDLKNFRKLHSKTPGHPEYGYTPGVETTSGPLGQGIANAVGMALAEKTLAAEFNRDDLPVVDHYTYVFMGDGCLMEGISHEVCSLAGTLRLGKLIAFWDDNNISIDGHVDGWFSDDTAARFRAYGWHVIADIDGHSAEQLRAATLAAREETSRPTLICCKTTIGYGSPNKADSHDCHGSPLGSEEVALVREALGWEHPAFVIPQDIYARWQATDKGANAEHQWQALFDRYQAQHPQLAAELLRRSNKQLPEEWHKVSQAYIRELQNTPADIATRQASQRALNHFIHTLPELLGGSADLSPSNLTRHNQATDITAENPAGNYLSYGVREFGMSAMMNGIALHGGFIPYGGTFLMFMEYARNAVRMAALMKQRSIFVYTHDSVGLGEDGPTHQPVEQLAALRLTPNMETWRGCDQVEAAVSWQQAIERADGPSALVFTRQPLAQQPRTGQQLDDIARGGYILREASGTPELVIISSGSEIELAVFAAETLEKEGRKVRVVSMPCTERFEKQDAEWKNRVLPNALRNRLVIEASIEGYWTGYAGLDGKVIGMKSFGESAPAAVLFEHFGFSKDNALSVARTMLR